jgi:hypothetical protein
MDHIFFDDFEQAPFCIFFVSIDLNVIDLIRNHPPFLKGWCGDFTQRLIKIPLFPPLQKGD